MEQPLVSVLMCSFKSEKYIAEAIESVLASTYNNFELIIVDNCSNDNTLAIAKKYEKKDPRIKVYQNETNIGQFPNRNKASSYSIGQYIKFLDSDDLIKPDGLRIMVDSMLKFPSAAIGVETNNHIFLNDNLPTCVESRNAFIIHYEKGGILFPGPSGCIYKKDSFSEIKGFSNTFGIISDTFLNLQIASQAPIVLLPPNLIYWRQHSDQLTNKANKSTIIIERFLLNKNILSDIHTPLLQNEKWRIKVSLKILTLRALLVILIKFDIKNFRHIKKHLSIKLWELVLAFLPLRLWKLISNSKLFTP